ncbi:MAG: efflux RND transporter periplasmic adaptor subunit [Bacteroidales bacterium]
MFLLLFLLPACTTKREEASPQTHAESTDEITEVRTQLLRKSDFRKEIISQGSLQARAAVEVTSTVTEPVVELLVANGSLVEPGQLLIRLDDRELQREIRKLELALEKVKRERDKQLIAKLGYGFSTGDSARIPADVLHLVNLDAGYPETLLELEEARERLRDYHIRAPIRGRVADVQAEPMNPPGSGPLLLLLDDRVLEAVFPVLENHLADMKSGDRVRISPLSGGDDCFGPITDINPRVSEGGMILVRARIDNPQGKLLDGMKCQVAVEKVIPDQLVIPKSALVMRDNRKVIFYFEDGEAYWQYVATPYENSSSYAITGEDGEALPEGKEVIVEGNMNLAHESKVVKTDG